MAVLFVLISTFIFGIPSVVYGADAAYSKEDIRRMQEQIVDWKKFSIAEDDLLAGELLENAGSSESDWYAFCISRMGAEDQQGVYLGKLQAQFEDLYKNMDENLSAWRATDWYRMVLTITACGGDPTAFGKDAEGNPINLIEDGVYNSVFEDIGKQGLNGYLWALIVLESEDYQAPEDAVWTESMLVEEILARQQADGGFSLSEVEQSDVDMTAMTLAALASFGEDDTVYEVTNVYSGETVQTTVAEAAETAFACMSSQQKDDGTMASYEMRSSESTGWAMLALASWGRDCQTDEDFIKNGNTLLDGMIQFRLEDGSFIHSLDSQEKETEGNIVSTYQALYCLEGYYRYLDGAEKLFSLRQTAATDVEQEKNNGFPVWIVGIVMLIAAVLILVFVKKKPKDEKEASAKTTEKKKIKWEDDADDEW